MFVLKIVVQIKMEFLPKTPHALTRVHNAEFKIQDSHIHAYCISKQLPYNL